MLVLNLNVDRTVSLSDKGYVKDKLDKYVA